MFKQMIPVEFPRFGGKRSEFVLPIAASFIILGCVVGTEVWASPALSKEALNADQHLVGWWAFDEAEGNRSKDASTRGHPAMLKGEGATELSRHLVPGRVGKALSLDGRQSLVVSGYKGVTGTQPRTVVVWIKTSTSRGNIVSWGGNDAGKMWNFGFVRGRVGITPKGGYLYMKEAVHDDVWHQVAAVIREASPPNLHDDAVLYLDGELAEIHDIGLLDLWPIDTGGELDVQIGRGFKGLMDDLRLYDRALSAEEINVLFQD